MNCFYLRSESLQTFSDKIGVPREKKSYTEQFCHFRSAIKGTTKFL